MNLTPYFVEYSEGHENEASLSAGVLQGLGASNGIISGEVCILNSPEEAMTYNDLSQYIIVTQNTDPAWLFIINQAKGLISEKGSLLSHTAIIGRELGIPTVVGLKKAKKILKNKMCVSIDGKLGTVEIISRPNE